jgi:rhodanese-related sulfurtransferase
MKVIKNIVLVFIAISTMSCTCKQKVETQTVINSITVDELSKKGNSIQLLDVRTPEEFDSGYINNATNINFFDDDFITQVTSKLNKDKPVYLYCKVGGRSGKAAKKLKEAGFTSVYDLKGGFDKWKSSLKPITQIK